MAGGTAFREITKYLVTAVCTQPLHIGSALGDKEEVLVHPVDDVPFIQASGIAGILRRYYAREQGHGEEQTDGLFGARRMEEGENAAKHSSRIRISDGRFCKGSMVLELRPRVGINPETGSCESSTVKGTDIKAGHKFNMEYIGAGAEFEFEMYLYDDGKQEEVEGLLAALHQEQVQLGGQKSNGCGFMKLASVKKKVFDMTSAQDRSLWAAEDELGEAEYTDILPDLELSAGEDRTDAFEVTVTGRTEGNLLVKSIAVPDCGKNAPDCMNLRNAHKDYIVPGSSLKGALRSQMEKIAGYLNRQEIIRDTFGYKGSSQKDSKAGNIVVYDTVVGDRETNDLAELSHRIHIDKFTGGVMDGGLFQEKNAAGAVNIKISIKNRNHPERTCGLLLLALRDLAIGVMNIGSGYNVGKGMIDVSEIRVKDRKNGEEAVISFGKDKGAGSGETAKGALITRCLKAVQAQRKEDAAV